MLGSMGSHLSILARSWRSLQSILAPSGSSLVSGELEPTVILGGGIIGLSTAYYLSQAEHEALSGYSAIRNNIVVIDPSPAICAGASGQNEGVLGQYGFKDEIVPLARLSYDLHAQLASKNDGRKAFGYGHLKIHTVFSHGYDPSNPKLPFPVREQEDLSELPPWFNASSGWQAGVISNGSDAAIAYPPQFCKFLQNECERLGVQFMLNSTASRVHTPRIANGLSSVDIQTENTKQTRMCRNLVIAAGSWSDKVFDTLFPAAGVKIPMAKRQPAQTWLRIGSPGGERSCGSDTCDQVWLSPALDGEEDLHISSSFVGDMFVAGSFKDSDPPPPLPQDVHPNPEELASMRILASRHLKLDAEGATNLTAMGRAYLPRTTNDLPVIAKVPWSKAFPGKISTSWGNHEGGVFLNVGHYLDGFTLGPGSGKVMSELIMGREVSVDLRPFAILE